jgi:YidC/Oxa1 family membrane protein insertase
MAYLYNLFIYQPLLNLLIFLYETVAFHDFGVAIILVTIIVRLLLYPLFYKVMHHQTIIQHLEPHKKKIEELHAKDKEKQMQELMALYKEHGVNPFVPLLISLLQLPVFIAVFHIFSLGPTTDFSPSLYGFIPHPGELNASFLGLINLRSKSILLLGLAAFAIYMQAKLSFLVSRKEGEVRSEAEEINRKVAPLIAPLVIILIGSGILHIGGKSLYFPAAVSLYILTSTLFSIPQQLIVNRKITNGKLGTIRKKDS